MSDGVYQIDVVTTADGVDAGINKAKAALTGLGSEADKAAAKVSGIGNGSEPAAQKLDRSTKSIISSIQRTTAVMEAGERGTTKYYEALASQRGANTDALKPYLAQLEAATAKQAAATGSLDKMGLSAKQTSAALRGVPAQFTDIFTSLQGGQAPMTVFLQQGGQLKDMFGGAGAAARAMGGYVLGMINPMTLAAAAVGTLGYAFYNGSEEAKNMAKAIIMSGNAAGTSVNQLKTLAASVSASTGATKGAVTEALDAIVSTGNVAAGSLGNVAAAAIKMEKATGTAVADTVKQFAELGKSPVDASLKLNEQYNYLTASVYKQIKALEDQGRTVEAVTEAQNAYANALNERSDEIIANVGAIESAWKGIKGAAKGAWDAMLNVGREDSIKDQIEKLQKQLATGGYDFALTDNDIKTQIAALEKKLAADEKTTAEKLKQSELDKAGIAWARDSEKYLSKNQQMEAEITKARNQGLAAGVSDLEITKRIAAIREKFTEKTGKSQMVKDAESLAQVMDKLTGKDVGLDATYWKDLATLFKAYKGGALDAEAYSAAVGKLTTNQKFHKDAVKEEVEAQKALTKHQQEYMKGIGDELEKTIEKANAAELENSRIGMTADQLAALTAQRYEEIIAQKEAILESARQDESRSSEVYLIEQQIAALRRLQSAEVAKPKLQEQAREWEKFTDDINRSLTDALYRAFESGESFGSAFSKSLVNTFKTMALRLAVNYTVDSAGSLVNAGINAIAGTSGANGGAGTNYLGLASNASSMYSAYSNAGLAYQGLTGSMSLSNVAGTYYANATGTGLDGLLATNGAYGTAASGSGTASGAGASSGSGAMGTVAWVAAIVAGMWMSSEAYKSGIRWENYAKEKGSEYDLETYMRASTDEPMRAIFGDDFVDSEFYAVMGGGSLSAQIHGALKKALWGGQWEANGDPRISGTFTERSSGLEGGTVSQKFSKDGGWFGNNKSKTKTRGFSGEMDAVFDTMYRGVRNSYIMAGEVFEDDTLAKKLSGFTFGFAKVNAKNMQTAFSQISEQLAESMGNLLFPSISALRKSGEAWSSAFGRIMQESSAVARVFDLMGDTLVSTFGRDNADGILRASDNIVQLFGSIDALNQSFGAYYGNFYTQAEQVSQSWEDMAANFAMLGKTMPTTRQGFRDLVDSLDLSTASGQSTFAALMSIQGAFAALTPTIESAVAAIKEVQAQQIGKYLAERREAQADLIRDQIDSAQEAANSAEEIAATFSQIVDSLSDYRSVLIGSESSALSPEVQYTESKRLYESTAAKAKLGDSDAASSLATVADAFLKAALNTGTAESYARDFGGVLGNIDAVMAVADRQIPIAETALQVAQDQLDALNAMLDKMTGNQGSIVVNDYARAATDWASFFSSTAVGDVVKNASGAMQRISASMGMFIDKSGAGYTFSADESPYALAGESDAFRQYMLAKYGKWQVPAFDVGTNYVPSDMLAMVHEGERIIPAADNAQLLNGSAEMVDELRALRAEVSALREEQRAGNSSIANNTGRTARMLDKFDIDGMPEVRAA